MKDGAGRHAEDREQLCLVPTKDRCTVQRVTGFVGGETEEGLARRLKIGFKAPVTSDGNA
jgi:hypothetical protein